VIYVVLFQKYFDDLILHVRSNYLKVLSQQENWWLNLKFDDHTKTKHEVFITK
jgi:hypothetical protein